MSARTRAVFGMLGGVVVIVAGVAQMLLAADRPERGTFELVLLLSFGWATLTGVVIVAAGWAWRSSGRAQRGLATLALCMACAGITAGFVSGILVDPGADSSVVDAGDSAFLMYYVPLQHGISVVMASIIRRESTVAAGQPAAR